MCDNSDIPPKKERVLTKFLQKDENGLIKCKKCNTNNGFVLLQRKDVFCRNCLSDYCSHKFRSTIGKSKLVRSGDRVLIAFSAGINSSAMIDMIKDGLNDSQHKKLRFIPSIVYIDESIVCEESDQMKESTLEEIRDIMLKTGWDAFMSSIEMNYRCNDSNFYVNINKDLFNKDLLSKSGQQFMDSFSSIKSITSKEEFLKRMRYLLVCEIAKKEKFDKIFFANNASNLAINLMSDVAIGKGIQLQSESGFIDCRHGIPILRPMREFTSKEIAFYSVLKKLNYVIKPTLVTNSSIKSSIRRLTESFVNTLQNDFPATVYTIFNTGNKLKACDINDHIKCIICKSSLDIIDRPQCSAYEALQLTNNLSKNLNYDFDSNSEIDVQNSISSQLCYGCRIIANEMTGIDNKFPTILTKKVDKSDIQEFLIDSNDNDVL